MLQDVLRQIEQRERFVLTSHARPDGDAVGSALACCQVLRAMGKQAVSNPAVSSAVTKRPLFWSATAFIAPASKDSKIVF